MSSSTDSIWFLIYEISTWQPIGFTWLDSIDYRYRTGSFAISIGEESIRRGLEPDQIDLAWNEGASMSLSAAIKEAFKIGRDPCNRA